MGQDNKKGGHLRAVRTSEYFGCNRRNFGR